MSDNTAFDFDMFNIPGRRRVGPAAKITREEADRQQQGSPDMREAYERWQKTPSPQNQESVLQSLGPTIDSAIKTYGGGNQRLRVQAYSLANGALKTYDPSKGTALRTHVYNHLQRLSRIAADRRNTIHIPDNQRIDSQKVQEHVARYHEQHGYEPSLANISDALGISRKRVQLAMNLTPQVPEFHTLSEKGDALVGVEPDTLTSALDYLYHDSDDTDQKILEWTTGYGGVKRIPKVQIAQRLKMTPAGVSYRLNQMLKRLSEGVEP